MKYPCYLVDAFSKERFAGNQAAVCLIPKGLTDKGYQKIAAEFNLSETAYPVPLDGKDYKTSSLFSLRWFTPQVEVPLCGHATLATSHVLLNEVGNTNSKISFDTQSGILCVSRGVDGAVEMDFPQYRITSVKVENVENPYYEMFPEFEAPFELMPLIRAIVPSNITIVAVAYASAAKKLIVVIDPETTKLELSSFEKNSAGLLDIHPSGHFVKGLVVTMRPLNPTSQGFSDSNGVPYTYICRYFAPWVGIDEDPATGSAQCALAPFWGRVLSLGNMHAFQCFPSRGAQFNVHLCPDERVRLVGSSVTVVRGEIELDNKNEL